MKYTPELSEVFELLPTELTKADIEMLWCREMLRRTKGNRTKSGELLGVSYRTVVRYIEDMRLKGLECHEYDITSRKKRGPNKEKKVIVE